MSVELDPLFEAADDRIWAGTSASGAFVIDPRTRKVRIVPEIRAFTETPTGETSAGTPSTGIITVDAPTLRTRILRHLRRGREPS